jgi:superfamily II DNA or RNA helicase
MDDIVSEFEREHLRALVWLLRTDRLEIRVSLLKGKDGKILPASTPTGVQHSKVGIVTKASGKEIAFLGGINESMRAYCGNAELLTAWYSWKTEDLQKISICKRIFDVLWNNQSPKSYVMKFPEACRRELIARYKSDYMPDLISETRLKAITKAAPSWKHQDLAIQEFISKERGILEMATGTGKTRTAMRIIRQLLESKRIRGCVVATYGNDLLDQWYRELVGFFPPSDTLKFRHYGNYKEMLYFHNGLPNRPSILIVSYDNLADVIMQDKGLMLGSCLLVCDEIHNIGSAGRVKALKGKVARFPWRLGLSATPEREYDKDGNDFIENEIGPVIFRFSLADAIRKGILCEFEYVPLQYELSDQDMDRMQQAYAKFNSRKKNADPSSIETLKKELWIDLAKVRKLSENKLPVFGNYLSSHTNILQRGIIFVETMDYGQKVQEIIHPKAMDYHTYYGDDESENLARFSKGDLSCLITCQRISEGIDIKSVRSIVLFSCARAKLETIQRIGRCLRTDPLDPDKRSVVVDFVRGKDFEAAEDEEFEPVDAYRHEWLSKLSKVKREDSDE